MSIQFLKFLIILFLFTAGFSWAQESNIKQNETLTTLAPQKIPDPITGAFGILLGELFEPAMVTKVITEQPVTYLGINKSKLEGTLYKVEPGKPDTRFQNYSIKTTSDGVIFAIQAEFQYEVEKAKGKKAGKIKNQRNVRSICKSAVKDLATEIEASHGAPRGKGWNGEWFSFRQISDHSDKKISLYANQCRTGLYRIIYSDEKARKQIMVQ